MLPDKEPPRDVIEMLLEAANHAPNHYLTQPWRFFVLRGDARLCLGKVIMEEGLLRWPALNPEAAAQRREHVPRSYTRAPVVIVVASVPGAHPHVPPWEDLAATAAAIQNILIAAHALGLAAYWRSNGTESQHARRFLGLPPEAQLVGFIYVGYPEPKATLPEKPRRPYTQFVRWMGWDGSDEDHSRADSRLPDGLV